MKKTLYVFFVASLFLAPVTSFGAKLVSVKDYTLPKESVLNESLYSAGGNTTISGIVKGDLVLLGGSIVSLGSVSGNAEIIGGDISLSGTVVRNIRVVGGKILFNGTTYGEGLFAGGEVTLDKNSNISGDALVFGGKVSLLGTTSGNVTVRAGQVFVDGIVSGNLDVISGNEVVFGPNAKITGNVNYKAFQKAEISSSATIGGKTTFSDLNLVYNKDEARSFFRGLWGIVFFVKLLITILVLVLCTTLFKKKSRALVFWQNTHFGKMFLVGLCAVVFIPIISIFLFASIIGSLLGVIFVSTSILLISISHVFSGPIFGAYFYKIFTKKTIPEHFSWREAVLCTLLLYLVSLIPFVGPIIFCVTSLISLGIVINLVYHKLNHLRE